MITILVTYHDMTTEVMQITDDKHIQDLRQRFLGPDLSPAIAVEILEYDPH